MSEVNQVSSPHHAVRLGVWPFSLAATMVCIHCGPRGGKILLYQNASSVAGGCPPLQLVLP